MNSKRGGVGVPGWTPEIWASIDEAVHAECKRTKIAAKFLCPPVMVDPGTLTVPSDTVRRAPLLIPTDAVHLTQQVTDVDPVQVTPIVEIQVLFRLTQDQVAQVAGEPHAPTAVTLAMRAANLLSQGEDILIFQGDDAVRQHTLFAGEAPRGPDLQKQDPGTPGQPRKVQVKSGRAGKGLYNLPYIEDQGANREFQLIPVNRPSPPPSFSIWAENVFLEVSKAYARLQGGEGLSQAHYGPYALVLHHVPYADTFAPLATTLVLTADRIKPLVTGMADGKCHFYGTGTLPSDKGIFLSVGGNTLDLIMAQDATTECVQMDPDGYYRFRVFERFAVREKDVTCVVRLDFRR